ncbi:SagB/ThcOx family dehydrogenase [Streptomyces sp. DSM 44915]|uniref:SagB/ThcOx family dehydrogenase n=1 Tax=Streptomyces chisholmiae TaxID=3075540 RepID=A0ABU2JNE7_9ACTN|nr:SagB/ThcOx family dehydrogenase [Streptomyces sp. DSM 44915]MDT0266508.1 SagB/ThcOx family dehydrogenase [Streptomyces sp. DSM 44915]
MPDAQINLPVFTPRYWEFLTDDEPPEGDLAEDYHEASKFYRGTMGRAVTRQRLESDEVLRRSSAIGARELPHLPRLPLAPVDPEHEQQAAPALIRRPSCRDFAPQPLPVEQLGRALWLSYGAYQDRIPDSPAHRRPVASGGGLYPLELYLVADVTGSGRKGLYHYYVHDHVLEEVRAEVTTEELRELGAQPDLVAAAPAIVLINGLFWRNRFKYRLRGYRFALLEAGAVIQQLTLVAQSFGWGVVPFAGLYDDVVERLCEIDGVDESFLNAVFLGLPE